MDSSVNYNINLDELNIYCDACQDEKNCEKFNVKDTSEICCCYSLNYNGEICFEYGCCKICTDLEIYQIDGSDWRIWELEKNWSKCTLCKEYVSIIYDKQHFASLNEVHDTVEEKDGVLLYFVDINKLCDRKTYGNKSVDENLMKMYCRECQEFQQYSKFADIDNQHVCCCYKLKSNEHTIEKEICCEVCRIVRICSIDKKCKRYLKCEMCKKNVCFLYRSDCFENLNVLHRFLET